MDPYIEQLRQWLELRLEVVAPGRYEFREFLAAGGLGAVYRYHDRSSLDIDVAVKVIDPEKLSTVSADQQVMILRRFTNEARVDAYLRKRGVHVHPVVYLHDAQASPAFMITDLLHGPTFEQRMQVLRSPGQPLEVDKIVGALAALAPSLAAIHKVGVIHRDLKPTNVILVPDEHEPAGCRGYLIDFGMAHVPEGGIWKTVSTRPGELWITQTYASPEKLRGEGVITDADDMYAFGVMAYRALSGLLPFEDQVRLESEPGTNDSAIITKACQWRAYKQGPTDLRQLASQTPPALAHLVMELLAVDPSTRPSASQVAAELHKMLPKLTQVEGADATLISQSVGARITPASSPAKVVTPTPKKKSLLVAALALSILMLGGLAIAVTVVLPMLRGPKEAPPQPTPTVAQVETPAKPLPDVPREPELLPALKPLSEFVGGHTKAVSSVALSRDGKLLASSGDDGLLCLWQLDGSKLLDKQQSPVAYGLGFHPAGTMLATRGRGGFRLWQIEGGKLVPSHTVNGPVVFLQNGQRFFESPAAGVYAIRDVASGSTLRTIPSGLEGSLSLFGSRVADQVGILGYNAEGQLVCKVSDADGNTRPPYTTDLDRLPNGEACITMWGMSADLQYVYFDNCAHKLTIWKLLDGKRVTLGRDGEPVAWCETHPRRALVALASRPQGSAEGTLAIWDLVTGEQRLVVKEKEKLVRALSFSDDGRLLAAATPDPTPKLFQIAE